MSRLNLMKLVNFPKVRFAVLSLNVRFPKKLMSRVGPLKFMSVTWCPRLVLATISRKVTLIPTIGLLRVVVIVCRCRRPVVSLTNRRVRIVLSPLLCLIVCVRYPLSTIEPLMLLLIAMANRLSRRRVVILVFLNVTLFATIRMVLITR